MRAIFSGAAAVALMALAGCTTAPQAPPARAPAPEAPPPPAPPPPSPPPPTDWRDLALTPGDWTWRADPAGSAAEFGAGAPAFALRCRAGQIVPERAGAAAGARLVVRTSFGERTIASGAPIPAADPLFDQIAFSRGRFTIVAEGLPMLVIPSWPEPARAIEDCRG
jgi:hypothetical protein